MRPMCESILVLFSYSERNLKPEDTEREYYIAFIKLLRENSHAIVMVALIEGGNAAAVGVQKGRSPLSKSSSNAQSDLDHI
jgi:hypothetical protein